MKKDILQSIQQPIEGELVLFKEFFREEFSSLEPIIGDVTEFLLSSSGKLLRPIIVLLSAKMLGEISQQSYVAATAIESFHTATLVHDDVVDNASMRRGKPSVQAQWTPQIAVLAGDYLLAKSIDIISKNEAYKMLGPITHVVRTISEGELFQIKKAMDLDTNEDDYFKIIYKKTASLISVCAQLGALSVDAGQETIEKMSEIARNLGLAFQIKDDIFDFDRNNAAGKLYGNDLKEQKLTLPLIYALKQADEAQRVSVLQKIKNCSENEQFIDEIIDFTVKSGGISYAKQKMNDLLDIAINMLGKFPENDARNALILYAEYIATREK